jgi:hypothetical protein
VNPAKRLITRTAIDPTLGTAAAARLFSQRVITEGQTFRATIEVPEDLAPILAKLLAHPFNAAIGTGRSRGQGWVEVREESFPQSSWDIAARRFEQFREATGKSLLIVTLLSDAIFQDDYLRDRTGPHAKDLRPLLDPLGLNMDEWEERPDRNLSFAATRLVFGFDGRPLFLPRPPRLAVSMGSVFGFQPQPGKTPIPPRGRGRGLGWIGHNRQEGFGRATLWHPFHLDPEKEWHYE